MIVIDLGLRCTLDNKKNCEPLRLTLTLKHIDAKNTILYTIFCSTVKNIML